MNFYTLTAFSFSASSHNRRLVAVGWGWEKCRVTNRVTVANVTSLSMWLNFNFLIERNFSFSQRDR